MHFAFSTSSRATVKHLTNKAYNFHNQKTRKKRTTFIASYFKMKYCPIDLSIVPRFHIDLPLRKLEFCRLKLFNGSICVKSQTELSATPTLSRVTLGASQSVWEKI